MSVLREGVAASGGIRDVEARLLMSLMACLGDEERWRVLPVREGKGEGGEGWKEGGRE